MKRAFYLLAMAAASLSGGCQLYHHMHHGPACPDGCGQGCPPGGQGCNSACAGGPSGQCADCDGHPDPYELLHLGQQGPSQRSGVFSWLGNHNGAGMDAGGAQPAPGPSAGAVSYPYYTNRGPRDFLSPNPRGIGP